MQTFLTAKKVPIRTDILRCGYVLMNGNNKKEIFYFRLPVHVLLLSKNGLFHEFNSVRLNGLKLIENLYKFPRKGYFRFIMLLDPAGFKIWLCDLELNLNSIKSLNIVKRLTNNAINFDGKRLYYPFRRYTHSHKFPSDSNIMKVQYSHSTNIFRINFAVVSVQSFLSQFSSYLCVCWSYRKSSTSLTVIQFNFQSTYQYYNLKIIHACYPCSRFSPWSRF